MKLRHILQSSIPVHIELDRYRSEELKRAARLLGRQGSESPTKKKSALLP